MEMLRGSSEHFTCGILICDHIDGYQGSKEACEDTRDGEMRSGDGGGEVTLERSISVPQRDQKK